MGAWGAGSFENDAASDWAAELAEHGDVGVVRDTLLGAARCPPDEELDADDAAEALAAAEVVAAGRGRPAKAIPMGTSGPHALAWAAGNRGVGSDDMTELALEALDRVEGDASELAASWAQERSGGGGAGAREWFSEVEDLRNRLSG
jgi:Domain of unknown function (DUF4259)